MSTVLDITEAVEKLGGREQVQWLKAWPTFLDSLQ